MRMTIASSLKGLCRENVIELGTIKLAKRIFGGTMVYKRDNRGIKTLYPEQTIATGTTTAAPAPAPAPAAPPRLSGNDDNVRLRHYQLNGKQWRY
ncbi:hypothetical protein M0804_003765 [Polistes exclamans]|nr:hypothetical protein M0804_003765 [Polistes exclamans]